MGVRAGFGLPAPAAPAVPAVPGEITRCELTVENTGTATEDVHVELEGDAATYGWATPPTLSLAPGEAGVVAVNLKLPRAAHPPAGPLPVSVLVTFSAGRVVASTAVDVVPFVDVAATLDPPTSRGRHVGQHVLRVVNRGNAPLAATVVAESEELAVDVEPAHLEAPAGGWAQAEVVARGRPRALGGGAGVRTFSVLVRPDGPGRPARVEGAVELASAGWFGRVAVVLLALAVAGVGLSSVLSSPSPPPAVEATAAPAPASPDCPGRDHLSPDANGVVRPGVQPSFDYTFLFVEDGCRPARFNPCAPVRYTLNRRLASDAHVADLQEALRKTSAATGLEFEFAGTSDMDPLRIPPPVRQADGRFSWPPVHIGWARLGSGAGLRQQDAVRDQPEVVVGGGGRPLVVNNVITTGNLVLNLDAVTDTDTNRPVPHGFGPGVNWGRIMLHELAHVIGLGHVQSRTSIMNEALTQQTISSSEWGVGDLFGLRHLGRDRGCLDVPPVDVRGAPR